MAPDHQRLVIGLGTGRCGTHSLADLLALQPDTTALHQPKPCLPWHIDYGWYGEVAPLVAAQPTGVVALVGWYYLNYVDLLARDHDVRVACLQRDRDRTVASIDRLTRQFDHWSNRPPDASANTAWRPLFPQYDVADKVEALGRYWDEYHERCDALAARHPGRVRTFPTEALNDAGSVAELLEHLGYGPAANVVPGIRSGLMEDYTWDPGAA